MASNVTVIAEDARRFLIKTTPTMTLSQILSQALEKAKIPETTGYGLKHNKTVLDLSLSMRFANLAPGAKLDLIRVGSSTGSSAEINIALQLEEGRFTGKFKPTTPLWDVLRHFETQPSTPPINLTRREAVPPSDKTNPLFKALQKFAERKSAVYMMPVLIVMNKEFSSIPVLHETTLATAGLGSGGGVIRVLYRFAEFTLTEALTQAVECLKKAQAGVVPAAGAPTAAPASSAAPVSPAAPPTPTKPAPAPEPATSVVPAPVTAVAASPAAVPAATVSPTKSSAPEPSPPQPQAVAQSATPSQQDGHDLEDTVAPPPEETGPFDRKLALYEPPTMGEGGMSIELPDSFFELTQTELKHLLAQSRRQVEKAVNRPLLTKELREQEQKKQMEIRKTKYPKTRVRVRFPDMVSMEATFLSDEPFSALHSLISSVFYNKDREYHLTTPGLPKKDLDPNSSFMQLGLAPACNIYVSWNNPADGPAYLSAESKTQLKPHPKTVIELPPTEPMVIDQKDQNPAGRTLGGGGSSSGAAAAGPSGPSTNPEGGGDSEEKPASKSKMPAWLTKGLKK